MTIPASAIPCAFPNEVCPRDYHYKPDECLGNAAAGVGGGFSGMPTSALPPDDDDEEDVDPLESKFEMDAFEIEDQLASSDADYEDDYLNNAVSMALDEGHYINSHGSPADADDVIETIDRDHLPSYNPLTEMFSDIEENEESQDALAAYVDAKGWESLGDDMYCTIPGDEDSGFGSMAVRAQIGDSAADTLSSLAQRHAPKIDSESVSLEEVADVCDLNARRTADEEWYEDRDPIARDQPLSAGNGPGEFGDDGISSADLIERNGITATMDLYDETKFSMGGESASIPGHHMRVTLTNNEGVQFQVPYSMGAGIDTNSVTTSDIIDAIRSDAGFAEYDDARELKRDLGMEGKGSGADAAYLLHSARNSNAMLDALVGEER